MSSLIPYKRLTIKTLLSIQEAEALLEENIDNRNIFNRDYFGSRPSSRPFAGTVKNGRFNISNNIYRGQTILFFPTIFGKFHDDQNATHIDIRVRLSYIQTILFVLLFMSLAMPLFLAFLSFVRASTVELQYIAFGSVLLIFLYMRTISTFNHEADFAQYRLESLYAPNSEDTSVPTLWRSINLAGK